MGTPTGVIAIYDIRTSFRWKTLEGHVGTINAVEFDSKGNMLVSYCSVENKMRMWRIGA